jgi:hypothetical protein
MQQEPKHEVEDPCCYAGKGYSNDDAASRTLPAQVCRAVEKIEQSKPQLPYP